GERWVRGVSPTRSRVKKVPKLALSRRARSSVRLARPRPSPGFHRPGTARLRPRGEEDGIRCRSRDSVRARAARSALVAPYPDRCRLRGEPAALGRAFGGACRLDVAVDLSDELGLARKRLLLAQPLPELERQPLAVQVACEVEQERLDPALAAAVVRVRADRDRGAMT